MKTFIAALLVLLCSASYAQITLEHEIGDSNTYFTLIEVDSGEYYYMTQIFGGNDNVDIKLYDLDYNLVKVIDIPGNSGSFVTLNIVYITKRLFDLDDSLELVLYNDASPPSQNGWVKIYKESGSLLFSCENCGLGYNKALWYKHERGIHHTPNGTKMLIMKHYYTGDPLYPGNRIYGLPGRLPSHSAVTDDIAYIQSALNIESFPNPASDRIQVNYKLPAGTTSGFITIRDTKGAELQRHPINYTEETIALDTQGLSPGSYYCCLLTDDGRTAVKKMVVVR